MMLLFIFFLPSTFALLQIPCVFFCDFILEEEPSYEPSQPKLKKGQKKQLKKPWNPVFPRLELYFTVFYAKIFLMTLLYAAHHFRPATYKTGKIAGRSRGDYGEITADHGQATRDSL